MPVFRTLSVQNGLSYRDLSVRFDQQGLVLVDGPVGAGKSSIFDLLTHTLYGRTPKDGVRDNEILNRYVVDRNGKPFGYRSEATFENNGHEYRVVQERANEGRTGILFTEDGRALNQKKGRSENLDTQKMVADHVGYSLQEFYGGVYLTQGYTHDLVVGKPSQRSQYLIRFFGIDLIDRLIASVKDQVASSAQGADTSDLDGKLQVYESELGRFPSESELEAKLSTGEARAEKLDRQVAALGVQISAATAAEALYTNYQAALATVEAHALHGTAVPALKTELQTLMMQDARLADQERILVEQAELAAQLAAEKKLPDLEAAQTELQQQRDALKAYQADQPKRARIAKLEASRPENFAWDDMMATLLENKREKLTELQSTVKQLDADLNKLRALSDTCFTCLRPIDPNEHAEMLRSREVERAAIAKTLAKLQPTVSNLESARTASLEDQRIQQQIADITESLVGSPESLDIEATQKQVTELTAAIRSHIRYLELESKFHSDASVLDIEELRGLRKRWATRISVIREYLDLVAKVPETVEPPADIQDVRDEHARRSKELQEVKSEIAVDRVALQTVQRIQEQQRRTLQDRAEVQAKASKHRILQTLHVSLKDIRGVRLHDATNLLVQCLPTYLHSLFHGEDIRVDVSEDQDSCDLVFYKSGTRIPLEGASGGQQRKIGLAILFAFTQLVNRQTNMLVLDEPYTNLDARSRSVCYDILRDLLSPERKNKALTSIFVMSHEQDLKNQRFDQRWTIDYDGQFSTLRI